MSSAAPRTRTLSDEVPTMVLIAACYGGYLFVTAQAHALGLWIAVPVLAILLALHSSLQHEILHGHPFRNRRLDDALASLPIGLFVPYLRFKDTHLRHHVDSDLTDPYDDPESNFRDPRDWMRLRRPHKILLEANNTLAGRIVLGPMIGLLGFYGRDIRLVARGDRRVLAAYVLHAVGLLAVAAWQAWGSTLPWHAYLGAAYLAMSILKIRTFLEHRADDRMAGRSVIIEDRGPFALLFLNNNFHAVHHAHPGIVWHRLPARFRERREHFLRLNGGYVYASYLDVFRMYLLTRKDPVTHPLRPGRGEPAGHRAATVRGVSHVRQPADV